jgi:hypothetical protein
MGTDQFDLQIAPVAKGDRHFGGRQRYAPLYEGLILQIVDPEEGSDTQASGPVFQRVIQVRDDNAILGGGAKLSAHLKHSD